MKRCNLEKNQIMYLLTWQWKARNNTRYTTTKTDVLMTVISLKLTLLMGFTVLMFFIRFRCSMILTEIYMLYLHVTGELESMAWTKELRSTMFKKLLQTFQIFLNKKQVMNGLPQMKSSIKCLKSTIWYRLAIQRSNTKITWLLLILKTVNKAKHLVRKFKT